MSVRRGVPRSLRHGISKEVRAGRGGEGSDGGKVSFNEGTSGRQRRCCTDLPSHRLHPLPSGQTVDIILRLDVSKSAALAVRAISALEEFAYLSPSTATAANPISGSRTTTACSASSLWLWRTWVTARHAVVAGVVGIGHGEHHGATHRVRRRWIASHGSSSSPHGRVHVLESARRSKAAATRR